MSPAVSWTAEGEPYIDIGKEGVRLTPVRPDDIDDWLALKNDPAVLAANVFDQTRLTRDKAEEQLRARVEQSIMAIDNLKRGDRVKYAPFIGIRSAQGKLIGTCGFSDPFEPDPEIPEVYRKEYRHINFGYAISSAYAKQGIVLAAARAMVDFARDHLESDTIAAGALNSNPASQAILTKLGFQVIHHVKKTYEMPSGPVEIDGPWYTLKLR